MRKAANLAPKCDKLILPGMYISIGVGNFTEAREKANDMHFIKLSTIDTEKRQINCKLSHSPAKGIVQVLREGCGGLMGVGRVGRG